jgi:hypothetical protein
MVLPEYVKRAQKNYSQTEKGRLVRTRYYERNREKIKERVLNRYRVKCFEKLAVDFFGMFRNYFDE